MDHLDFLVDVFDEKGNVVEVKKRGEINRKNDLLKTVHLLVFDQSGGVYLSAISRQGDSLWKGTWGTTCAGIVRHGEDPYFAIARTMEREIGIVEETQYIGENFFNFDGVKRFVTLFTCTSAKKMFPNQTNIERIALFSLEEVEKAIMENRCAPTLAACWKMYSEK